MENKKIKVLCDTCKKVVGYADVKSFDYYEMLEVQETGFFTIVACQVCNLISEHEHNWYKKEN